MRQNGLVKLLLAGLLLLPLPAFADVTAHYAVGSSTITVEAADNGDSRFAIDSMLKVSFIRHDGVDYMVARDSEGVDRVTRADGAFAALIGQMPPPGKDMTFETSIVGNDTLVGYSGALWRYGPLGEPPLELLMSPDPRLARIGDAFRSMIDLIIGVTGSTLGPDQLRQVFAAGTPLRVSSMNPDKTEVLIALESVNMAAIDPTRFTLPGPVMPAADFAKLLAPPGTVPAVKIEVK